MQNFLQDEYPVFRKTSSESSGKQTPISVKKQTVSHDHADNANNDLRKIMTDP